MSEGSVVRSTVLVTAMTGTGLLLAFISNVLIAAKFGVGDGMDVYFAVVALPNFIITLVGSILASTFIPFYLDYQRRAVENPWPVVSSILNAYVILSLIISTLVMVAPEVILRALTPGFDTEKLLLGARLLRFSMPIVVLTTLNELAGGLFNAHGKFVLPALSRVLSPVLTIVFILAAADDLSIVSLTLASLSAAVVQTLIMITGLSSLKGFHYHAILDWKHPEVHRVFALAAPIALTMPIYKSVPLFDRWIGSTLPEGSISTLGYAMRLLNVIQPILISGIAISFFPLMSKQYAEHDKVGIRDSLSKSIRMLTFCSVPIALIVACLGEPMVRVLFQRGSFHAENTAQTYAALSIYLISLPWSLVGTMIGQGFYVLKDTRTPAVIGVLEICFYVAMCLVLVPHIGIFAIPVAYATYFVLSVIASTHFLARRLGLPLFPIIVPAFIGQFTASAVATTLGLLVFKGLISTGLGSAYLDLLPMAFAFIAYFAIVRFVWKTPEAMRIGELLGGFLRRISH